MHTSFRVFLGLTALFSSVSFSVGLCAQTAEAAQQRTTTTQHILRTLLFAHSLESAASLRASEGTDIVISPELSYLEKPEFKAMARRYLGQPISLELLNRLGAEITAFGVTQDRVLNTTLPSQDISAGEFRMIVTPNRYNELQFKGNRWFSRELLESKLGIKLGEEVRLSQLEEKVNWANTNPFRRIQVLVNNLPNQPGATDLVFTVQERIPLRVAASYSNAGTPVIGTNQYSASFQFGNVLGKDHQASYQFTTTDRIKFLNSHSADYRIPLPWRHYIVAAVAYARVQPTIANPGQNAAFQFDGKSSMADLRYTVPIQKAPYSIDLSGGLSFKRANNYLEWIGGPAVLDPTTADIFQLSLNATVVRRDKRGGWVVGAGLNWSPGDVTSYNSTKDFQNSREMANARYVYGSLVLQRLTTLPKGFQLVSRANAQLSSESLIGSEQMAIGGSGTVRGYRERGFAGDVGVLVSHELQGPVWKKKWSWIPKTLPPLEARPLVFWDYAKVKYLNRVNADVPLEEMMSTGVGLRCNIGHNFNFAFDYGWKIQHVNLKNDTASGRGNVRLTVAY